MDEVDSIGTSRGDSGRGDSEVQRTMLELLNQLDGFEPASNIKVIMCTNRLDILDPALKRPGRFDRQISIDKPGLAEREEIFNVHLKPVTLEDSISQDVVAKRTVALHESGHAVAGWFLEHAEPLLKVSIVPRSNGALGFAQYLPGDVSLYFKEAILDKMAMTLAGRAAEELFVGNVTTGAADDLDKVTKMAYSMVTVYGMNPELGLLSYSQSNPSEQFYKPYSEETGQLIDREVRNIVEEQYTRVKQLLTEKKALVSAMADNLASKETLVQKELREILGERPFGMGQVYSETASSGNDGASFDTPLEAVAAASDHNGDF